MRSSLFLVTDLYYQAQGREYFKEDVELSRYLRRAFQLRIVYLDDLDDRMISEDYVLIRNTGPLSTHKEALLRLKGRRGLRLSNDLKGRGDFLGKGYLLELFKERYPVIPTSQSAEGLEKASAYLIKPLDGCDSRGVRVVSHDELGNCDLSGMVLQPYMEFEYEVSFYFVDQNFQYALYAPDRSKRWNLKHYQACAEDMRFAKRFVDWNSCRSGIQRVDACRLLDGSLALMELEDYNPYLSFELLSETQKESFVRALTLSLKASCPNELMC